MRNKFYIILLVLGFSLSNGFSQTWSIAVHGGAGNMKPENFTTEQLNEYEREMNKALSIGVEILKSGGTSFDAVEQVVRYLEDCPLFNAGKGAVFTHEGRNELDAAIMDGKTLSAGAVAGVSNVKNPISLARKVMENSPHVMLTGKGASEFAKENSIELVDSSYFYTPHRWNDLQRALSKEKMGTVGCVALDVHGNLAAATSTGGMTNKRWGRVGDAPIIGAGTYANNSTCAVSATGHGEYFIRYTVAHDISALMEYQNLSLNAAVEKVVMGKLLSAGGRGGVIAVDRLGNVCMMMNTTGMFRAFARSNGSTGFAIF
ncbi:MAG: isoaspartyl peptidase/L-asparaginase [Bacteroidota bacterium]